MMFAEYGIEVYETMCSVWIQDVEDSGGKDAERDSSMIRVRACVE